MIRAVYGVSAKILWGSEWWFFERFYRVGEPSAWISAPSLGARLWSFDVMRPSERP